MLSPSAECINHLTPAHTETHTNRRLGSHKAHSKIACDFWQISTCAFHNTYTQTNTSMANQICCCTMRTRRRVTSFGLSTSCQSEQRQSMAPDEPGSGSVLCTVERLIGSSHNLWLVICFGSPAAKGLTSVAGKQCGGRRLQIEGPLNTYINARAWLGI